MSGRARSIREGLEFPFTGILLVFRGADLKKLVQGQGNRTRLP
jgi:hypothetical protein